LDDSYQIYSNRVAKMMLPESYKSQVQYIQPSPKFVYQASEGQYQTASFPGYSVITPPWIEETENTELYEQLQILQQQLVESLPADLLVPLPPDSFHMTLADLIWDGAYRHADANPDFQPQLRESIRQSFSQCRSSVQTGQPASWQVMGLTVMTRAVGVCLTPKDEDSYNRILELRRSIYQNSSLMGLGIEQQYYLNAHITLGYFGDRSIAEVDREKLGDTFSELNLQWLSLDCPKLFLVHQADLRKFDDMTRYYREPDWPQLVF
jgi:hypothetical protein